MVHIWVFIITVHYCLWLYCKTFPGEVPSDYNVVYITQTMQPLLIRLRTSVTFLAAQTRREQREGPSMITVVWTMPRRMPPTEMVMNLNDSIHIESIFACHTCSKDTHKHARGTEISCKVLEPHSEVHERE